MSGVATPASTFFRRRVMKISTVRVSYSWSRCQILSQSSRPRKNAPRFLHQDLQDIELARREGNKLAGTGNAAVLNVHLQVADLQQISSARGGSPAADCFDPGDQFVHRERFREVVIRASLQTFHPIFHLAARGQDEDPSGTLGFAEPGEQGEPVESWKTQVEYNQIGRF